MAKSETLQTASVLAFERKLDPSDALMSSGRWDDRDNATAWPAVNVNEKSVRGTISNRLKTKDQDPANLDAQIQKPNLQTVDAAALPADVDTLQLRFTLRVLSGAGTPSACNSADYQQALSAIVDQYVREHGFFTLALRYATNLANARFLWRNRLGAESICVRVDRLRGGESVDSWEFDALQYPLDHFPAEDADINALGNLIATGLAGGEHVLLDVRCFARMGQGQEVYPSQELILDKSKGTILDKSKDTKSRTLYVVDDAAAIHSQKIGNALRTIDNWYEGGEELGPIAVEPYGSVTTQGKAYRQPKSKTDFYNLLDRWVLKGEVPELSQQHYVMATLVRGGVFGEKAE